MDILQVQDRLKNFSQDQLVGEMQAPTGNAPQFLVLSEIMRRRRLQDDFTAQQGKAGSESTVAQEAIAAAGVPQSGIAGMAQAMAPSTDMTQNTGVQAMASGGTVKKMQVGGAVMTDPAIISMANRSGMSVEEFLGSLSPEEAANLQNYAARTATRGRMTAMEPVGEYATQADLDQRYAESAAQPDVYPAAPFAPTPRAMDYGTPLYQTLAGKTGNVLPPGYQTEREYEQARLAAEQAGQAASGLGSFGPLTADTAFGMRAGPDTTPIVAPPAYVDHGPGLMDNQIERAALIDAASNRAGPRTALPETLSEVEKQNAAGNPSFTLPELIGGYLPNVSLDLSGTGSAAVAGPGRTSAPTEPTVSPADAFEDRGRGAKPAAPAEGIAAVAAPATLEEAIAANEAPQGGGGGGAGGGGGGIAGAASGMTSYEQELMDALTRREQAATQDKWLALAQVGLNLMSSTNPTFGGALGEAGLQGVAAARGARDQYEKDRLDLTGALEQSRMSRAQAAAAAAKGAGGGGGLTPYQAATLARGMRSDINEELGNLYERAASLAPGGIPPATADGVAQYEATTRRIAALENELYGGTSAAPASTVGLADLADE